MLNKKKRLIISAGILTVIIAILMIWLLSGSKPGPDRVVPEPAAAYPDAETAVAVVETRTEWYDAVGTVVPQAQARIEPRVPAQVTEVLVNAGDAVTKGKVLVRLDDRQLTAKLEQARQSLKSAVAQREQAGQAVNAAQAAFAETESAYDRVKKFYEAKAAAEQELEQAHSRFLQAKAALQRAGEGLSGASAGIRLAEEMVQEAEIGLDYTRIVSPADGEILRRLVDPGDMAMPGKPLLLLQTAGGLQLEASVREGLIGKVRPGETRKVALTALDKTVDAVIDEIVPYADPMTRSFLVKAGLPPVTGIYPGMYGKLLIPYMDVEVILIPGRAVRRVGQLQLVLVKVDDRWKRRYIQTGSVYGDRVEVLSGLAGGETVMLKERGENDG